MIQSFRGTLNQHAELVLHPINSAIYHIQKNLNHSKLIVFEQISKIECHVSLTQWFLTLYFCIITDNIKRGTLFSFFIFFLAFFLWKLQKQPFKDVLQNRNACSFIKRRLHHKCFPVSIAKLARAVFLQSTCGGCF